jgi:aspartate-semialdehyde dehydrogenase
MRPLNVGVVGATGNVGRTMLEVLAEQRVPLESLRLFASASSEGARLSCGNIDAHVEVLDDADPSGLDVAMYSAGAERSKEHAQRFADAGCVVIDNSSAFRMDAGVPLVVAGVNDDAVAAHKGIIANPNCSTIQLMLALAPIERAFGLTHVHVTTFQAVSGTGRDAIDELARQQDELISGESTTSFVYPHQIAANVLPHCDSFDDEGNTKEEMKLVNESRKILGVADLPVSATCVRVPVVNGHSEAVHITTRDAVSPEEIRELLAAAPGVKVVDDPSSNSYPMPIDVDGADDVLVGRIRRDASRENGVAMFVVGDNLRVGAATNTVRITNIVARARS